MKTLKLTFPAHPDHALIFRDYLRLRKRYFCDDLGWPIWPNGDVETDQYDNPQAHYVIAHDGKKVLAGARLLSDCADHGGWSHMLADVQRGKIETIPGSAAGLDFDYSGVWECSRLVCAPDLEADRRREALRRVVAGLVDISQANGARGLVSVSPPPLMRLLRSFGYAIERPGKSYRDPWDKRAYCVLHMPFEVVDTRAA